MAQQHKRNMSLHYSAIALIVMIIFAVLSTTVFFNIETAVVTGSSIYTPDEIITVAGIRGGDNMIRKNFGRAEKKLTSQLIYIEKAEITRKLPSSVEINITPCAETASLDCEDGFMIVSGQGKILRFSAVPAEDTLVFYGTEPAEELKEGMTFASADEAKTKVITELMERRDTPFASKVTSFDVSNRLNINCVYDNRIDVELGVITDIDYKFRLAEEVLSTKISPESEGRLKMLEAGAQFLSKNDLEQIELTYERNSEKAEETLPPETEAPTETEANTSTKLNFE